MTDRDAPAAAPAGSGEVERTAHPRRRRSSGPGWFPPALIALGLVALIGLVSRITPSSPITRVPDSSLPSRTPPPPPTPPAGPPQDQLPSGLAEQPPSPIASAIGQILGALVIMVIIAVVVLIIIRVVALLRERRPPEGIDEVDDEPVVDLVEIQQQLELGRSEIDVSGEINAAVVRCWQGLEAAAGAAGVPRLPSQTAREYTVAVLSDAALPAAPLDALADVYERALFSSTPLTEDDRRTAVDSLRRLLDAVGAGDRP